MENDLNFALMRDIVEYVSNLDELYDIGFYVNGHRYFTDLISNQDKPRVEIIPGVFLRDEGEFDVREYLEYCNPDTVNMTFEGPFYADYNGYTERGWDSEMDINRIAEKYGLYPEMGYAWSLSFWPIPKKGV